MAKIPKVKTPSEAEAKVLKALMYDSSLFGAHPVIVYNVRDGVATLLRTLGRDDLADLWLSDERLLAV